MKWCALVLLAALLLLSACDIRKPVMPEWDVTLNIPLINEKYFVSDLVDSVNIVLGDGDILILRGTGSEETPYFGDVSFEPDINVTGMPIFSGSNAGFFPLVDPEDKVLISYGKIISGTLRTRFFNVANSVSQINLIFHELFYQDGTPYQISYPGNSGWQNSNLEGCTIGTLNSGTLLDQLNYTIQVVSTQPAGSAAGLMDFGVLGALAFDLFRGHLVDFEMSLVENQSSVNIEYPHNIEDAFGLQSAKLFIDVQNMVGFVCELHGNFYAENTRTGQVRSIPIVDNNNQPYLINPATEAGAGITELVFENNVEQLMQIMPDKIEIRDAFFLIDSSTTGPVGTVRSSDIIKMDYQLDAPFTFVVYESTIQLQDPTLINITAENRRQIQNNALAAELTLHILNKLPIGATATLYIGDSDQIDPAVPGTYAFSRGMNLQSSNLSPGEQITTLSLNKAELDVFAQPTVFMLWTFSFAAHGTPITITASPADYIQVKSMIRVGLRITEDI
ncbi:MAG: hypothetical protein Q8J62_09720 [Candidatus Cloacimonadaceae bacterium]|nr:hypothetical protein [Candidatus Cloacimonadaceae bacterium]